MNAVNKETTNVSNLSKDQDLVCHMMVIAMRVVQSKEHKSIKAMVREICKTAMTDKNLLRKISDIQNMKNN